MAGQMLGPAVVDGLSPKPGLSCIIDSHLRPFSSAHNDKQLDEKKTQAPEMLTDIGLMEQGKKNHHTFAFNSLSGETYSNYISHRLLLPLWQPV